jgi:hypothetical protein
MKKIKMQILKISPEETPNGGILLRINAKSDGKTFEFGVKEEDYYDDITRASIHKNILKKLRKKQAFNALPEEERKKQKDKNDKKMAALVGSEIEDDE